jgi:phage terminase large subunit
VDELLRGEKRLENSIIAEANWMDNPFFPEVLRVEMEQDRARDPDNYGHVWLGEYQRFAGGAIYGREMINAVEAQPSRVTSVPYNPAFPVITAWDLGYGDATAIWFCQIVGREPRLIDYYENNLLPLSHYVQHIKDKPYSYDTHILPHDAGHASLRTGTTLAKQLEDLGLGRLDRDIVVLPVDSVESGIQLGRNLINQTWFDRDKCKQGIAALRKYHYEYDEERKMFKNRPHHDWSSNGADSFRYLSTYLATRRENVVVEDVRPINYFNYMQDGGTGWMG